MKHKAEPPRSEFAFGRECRRSDPRIAVSPLSQFAPAKLNLFLAITGRRADGFHALLSLVAPLDFGDTLVAEPATDFSLTCSDPELAVDDTNLVLKAAQTYAAAVGGTRGRCAAFRLHKRIPVGAGLGGGSSDAVAALRVLNELNGGAVSEETLRELAAGLGSDCPLFLHDGPVIMRGRGEDVTPLSAEIARRLRGRRVLLFKPAFPVATAWAYGRLAALAREPGSAAYLPTEAAEMQLTAWLDDPAAPVERLLFNNLELPVFEKYLALPTMLARLADEFGLAPRLSGSGSTCFALIDRETPIDAITARVREGWGASAFVTTACLA